LFLQEILWSTLCVLPYWPSSCPSNWRAFRNAFLSRSGNRSSPCATGARGARHTNARSRCYFAQYMERARNGSQRAYSGSREASVLHAFLERFWGATRTTSWRKKRKKNALWIRWFAACHTRSWLDSRTRLRTVWSVLWVPMRGCFPDLKFRTGWHLVIDRHTWHFSSIIEQISYIWHKALQTPFKWRSRFKST
jgi:hypothetical protein